jgi:hypothetical protein
LKLRVSAERADRIETEVLAMFFFQDERPLKGAAGLVDWKMNGALSSLIIKEISSGVSGESTLVLPGKRINSQKILLFGLGDSKDCSTDALKDTTTQLVEQLIKINCRDFCLAVPPSKFTHIKPEDAAVMLVQGLATKKDEDLNVTILAEKEDLEKVQKSVEKVRKEVHIKEKEAEPAAASPAETQEAINSA